MSRLHYARGLKWSYSTSKCDSARKRFHRMRIDTSHSTGLAYSPTGAPCACHFNLAAHNISFLQRVLFCAGCPSFCQHHPDFILSFLASLKMLTLSIAITSLTFALAQSHLSFQRSAFAHTENAKIHGKNAVHGVRVCEKLM